MTHLTHLGQLYSTTNSYTRADRYIKTNEHTHSQVQIRQMGTIFFLLFFYFIFMSYDGNIKVMAVSLLITEKAVHLRRTLLYDKLQQSLDIHITAFRVHQLLFFRAFTQVEIPSNAVLELEQGPHTLHTSPYIKSTARRAPWRAKRLSR